MSRQVKPGFQTDQCWLASCIQRAFYYYNRCLASPPVLNLHSFLAIPHWVRFQPIRDSVQEAFRRTFKTHFQHFHFKLNLVSPFPRSLRFDVSQTNPNKISHVLGQLFDVSIFVKGVNANEICVGVVISTEGFGRSESLLLRYGQIAIVTERFSPSCRTVFLSCKQKVRI